MVGAIKRLLGIDKLERENAARAEEILALVKRVNTLALSTARAAPVQEEPKPKPKPKPVNWRTFMAAAEKASEAVEQP
jgi:hypothetical protein